MTGNGSHGNGSRLSAYKVIRRIAGNMFGEGTAPPCAIDLI